MGSAFFYVFSYAKREEKILYAVGLLAAALSGVAFPSLDLVYGIWLEAHAVPNPDPHKIRLVANKTALICLGIGVAQTFTSFLFLTCFNVASARLSERLRRAYLESVIHQDAHYFETVGAGEAATRLVKDIGLVKSAAGEKLGFIAWGLSTLIAAIAMAFTQAPRLAGVMLAIVPFGSLLFAIAGVFGEKYKARAVDIEGKASTFLEQILSSIRIVQAFAAEKVLAAKYNVYLDELQDNGNYKAAFKGIEAAIAYAILFLVYSTAFWFGSQEVIGGLEVGNFFTCFWNFFNALFAISNILPHISVVIDSISTQARLRDEINRVPAIDVRDAGGIKFDGDDWEATIELQNLSFAYPSRPDTKSLDCVSLKIPSGRVTAIVGASGSGKSTIATLLLRYYDPPVTSPLEEKGDSASGIFLAGNDLRDYNLRWLRSQIAVVSQEPQLFSTTIFDNVAQGLTGTRFEYNPDADDEKAASEVRNLVEDALKKAQAWNFVSNLPQGVYTKVSGARTGVLSGGQRQRVAVARALIRRPRILILDEGTSALDAEVEARLMQVIHGEQREQKMTTILIAHRLSTIQAADNIIVMDKGQVAEEGTYGSLIEKRGIFHNLVAHQIPNDEGSSSRSSSNNIDTPEPKQEISVSLKKKPMDSPARKRASHLGSDIDSPSLVDAIEKGQPPDRSESKQDFMFCLPRFITAIGQLKQWFIPGSFSTIALGASFPVAAWLVGLAVQTFSIQGDNNRLRSEAYRWSMWFLILALITAAVLFASGFLLEAGAERLTRVLRIRSLRAIIHQEVGFFDMGSNSSGTLTALVSSHSSNSSAIVGLIWAQILASAVNLLGAVILCFVMGWKLAVVGFIPLPFVFVAAWLNVVLLERYEASLQKPLEAASAFAGENVDNIKTVAALGRENAVMDHFDREAAHQKPPKRLLYMGSFGFGIGIGSILLVSAIVMAWGTELFTRNEIRLPGLFASLEAVIIAVSSAGRLFAFIPDLARAVHSFRSITSWEVRVPEVEELSTSKEWKGVVNVNGAVTFRNCSMKYVARDTLALSDVSLSVKAGQTVAFCGPSGGGKSTILALINRFYDPSSGIIEVDGIDIRAVPIQEYRSTMALVSQDAVLYEGTFRENIILGWGENTVTEAELVQACKDAHILDFIESLPEGFDTSVGYKGSQMSGGQRQRICIARALLRKPKILLLDEATSALDAESEKIVQQSLDFAAKGRTTIIVAHRLSTIQNADVIYVVEDGQIVEHGNHEGLLKKQGRYYDLVRTQL